ncbi:aldehyde dehydrogenase [Novosphingobium bradum]|uniref:Aldehyde dehydrogenase n=1 Tax=Novosphingobium bradum TaxID=1737444 RepID=A0ABV7IM73_9SPHN
MTTTTAPAAGLVRHPDRFYIDGQWAAPSAATTLDVFDSATEEVFLTVAEAQAADIDRAVASARAAFDTGPWPRMTPQERAPYLARIAEGWKARAEALGDAWTAESGMLRRFTAGGAGSVAGIFTYYAGLAESYEWVRRSTLPSGTTALIVGEAVGVVAAIVPWNGPASLIAIKCAPALLAGCTVVVKASPEAPASAYLFAEICEEAGLPPGVVNVVTADREVSELLVRDPRVDKVAFTGSTAAGKRIASLCGERIARTTLELGGKSPALILDDFDLGMAAKILAGTTSVLSGQVCAALTRIIVSKDRHDEMAEALAAAFTAIRVGDPRDPESQMGPVASARQRDRIEGFLQGARAEGVQLVCGGGRPAHLDRGYYIEPTVYANVSNAATIARQEVFGPVVCLIPAASEAEAIALANDTDFGLNSCVFTNDPDRVWSVGRQLRAGLVGHNGFAVDWSLPGGGFKQSGIGREGGVEGLEAYLETKTMTFQTPPSV